MFSMPWNEVLRQIAEVSRVAAVAVWEAVAAQPKLQLMLVGFVLLSLMGGGARGRTRRAH
jgi:hypothetical protein